MDAEIDRSGIERLMIENHQMKEKIDAAVSEAEADQANHIDALEKVMEAQSAVRAFMVMPQDWWEDRWSDERSVRYEAATKAEKQALAELRRLRDTGEGESK